jgi:eukaryotic-like serine/threonine-protein kinase
MAAPHPDDERQFGPYRLTQLIATGGMAEIHLAKTKGIEGFEKYVALKMIHPNFSSDDHFIQMLIDEAKISVQLQHANIAQTFDLGRVADTYYIAMEFVDGSDLFKILRKASEADRYMPIETAVYIAKEVAAGLDYAHRKRDASGRSLGIVHRDVSPQNVLISYAGEVKLVDFGIAKATMRAKQTAVGVIKGKYYYMSPEQAWGDPLDQRTDIFSAGILLYEMLTGQMLYLEEDMNKLLDMVRRADIPPPSTKRREVPRELDRIVMRALAKKPDLRFQSAQDYGTELEKWLHANAPDFTASRLAGFVGEVLGQPAPPPPPAAEAPRPDLPRVTKGLARQSIAASRSEFTDDNSVIFRPSELLAKASVSPNRVTTPNVVPQARARTVPTNRMSSVSGHSPTRPPPLPREPAAAKPPPPPKLPEPAAPKLTPVAKADPAPSPSPLAARLARAAEKSLQQPDGGTIDLGEEELLPLEAELEVDETQPPVEPKVAASAPAESTGDVPTHVAGPRAAEAGADEDPTQLDVSALAGRSRTARPSARVAAVAAPSEDKPAPAPRKRTPIAGVPVIETPRVIVESSGSSLPLAAPAEETALPSLASAPLPSTVWPPHTTDEEGDDFFGLGAKIGASRLTRRHLFLGLVAIAVLVGIGALLVAALSQPNVPEYATVDVISIPPHARVLVDGKELGATPLTLERVALERPFALRVELAQYEPWSQSEPITQAHVSVVASLKPILGTLKVESNPLGAEVFVNNRSIGLTPLERADLSPFQDGTVEVRKIGFKPQRQALEWKGGRAVSLRFDLPPAKD